MKGHRTAAVGLNDVATFDFDVLSLSPDDMVAFGFQKTRAGSGSGPSTNCGGQARAFTKYNLKPDLFSKFFKMKKFLQRHAHQ
jgi:hypothetical protein